jgi:hypothetical protein
LRSQVKNKEHGKRKAGGRGEREKEKEGGIKREREID